LLEILVALVMVGILAAIAIPSFSEAIRKGRRADAVALLAGVQQAQERFRANTATYAAAVADFPANIAVQTLGTHYSMAITQGNATSYTATATALSTSPQNDDTSCSVMSVQMLNGGIVRYTAGTAANTVNPCWSR
jgi:type IV pilus assembly protein PilE